MLDRLERLQLALAKSELAVTRLRVPTRLVAGTFITFSSRSLRTSRLVFTPRGCQVMSA